MAELLIRVIDKTNADFYANCGTTKRGDVIVIQPDGWGWGTDELTNPEWQILKIPGLQPSDLSALTRREVPTDPLNPSKTLQARGFRFDIASFVGANALQALAFKGDGIRHGSSVTKSLALASALVFTVQKTPIPDPNVIGGATNVIG